MENEQIKVPENFIDENPLCCCHLPGISCPIHGVAFKEGFDMADYDKAGDALKEQIDKDILDKVISEAVTTAKPDRR